MEFDKAQFIEELIQLQIKHGVLLEGYDMTLWTVAQGQAAYERHGKESFLVTEDKIRRRWDPADFE